MLTGIVALVAAQARADSNQPMSLGIPLVTIGGGGEGGNWHSVNEWYKPVDGCLGPQRVLFAVPLLQGLGGVTKPALNGAAGGEVSRDEIRSAAN